MTCDDHYVSQALRPKGLPLSAEFLARVAEEKANGTRLTTVARRARRVGIDITAADLKAALDAWLGLGVRPRCNVSGCFNPRDRYHPRLCKDHLV